MGSPLQPRLDVEDNHENRSSEKQGLAIAGRDQGRSPRKRIFKTRCGLHCPGPTSLRTNSEGATKKSSTIISPFVMMALVLVSSVSCIDQATDQQIEDACQNLTKITSAASDDAASHLSKCKRDLEREGISASAAQCRAEAANVDEFWNKCRR